MHKDSWLRYCALALALTAYGGSVGGIEPAATYGTSALPFIPNAFNIPGVTTC